MANRTQLRTQQVTASFGNPLLGHINDNLAAAASGSIVAADLTDVLSVSLSAIKRITGGTDFSSAAAGVFTHALTDFSGDIKVTGNDIKGSTGNTALTLSNTDVTVAAGLKIINNAITASDNGTPIVWDVSDNVTIGGDLRINGNDISDSGGNTHITFTAGAAGLTAVAGDLKITGNSIQGSAGSDAIEIDGTDVEVLGDLTVTGNDIKGSGGTVVTFNGVNTSLAGDLTVVGNDLDFSAGNANIGATIGANQLTIGASSTTTVIPGSLTVQGTTTTIDTTNLNVKDPVIAMGVGAQVANSNGGIAIMSGSAAGTDLVFGRIANDTFGVGILDTQSGSVTSLAAMAVTNLRAGRYEVDGATNYFDMGGADLKVVAAADVAIAPGGGQLMVSGGILPASNGAGALGSNALQWSDLFLQEGAVINFDNGDFTMTQTNNLLALAGGNTRVERLEIDTATNYIDTVGADLNIISAGDLVINPGGGDAYVDGDLFPSASNGGALGSTTLQWSDAFLAAGAAINFSNGNFVMTHGAAGRLTLNAGNNLCFGDPGEAIFGDGTDLYVSSSGDLNLIGRGNDISFVGQGAAPGMMFSRAAANTQYLNFSTNDAAAITGGTTGFGIRNNNGTMQFKNNGGDWEPFGAGGSADKKTLLVSGAGVPANARAHISAFDVSSIPVADRPDRIDAYVNGQLLLSGTSADYVLDEVAGANACDIRVKFTLVDQDVLTVVVR